MIRPSGIDDGGTLPAMTADKTACCEYHDPDGVEDVQCCDDCPAAADEAAPAEALIVIDMAYLYQRRMREMQAAGRPLPEGITAESLDEWEREHPDYDPAKPGAGQPLPPGVVIGERRDAAGGTYIGIGVEA